MKLKLHWQIFIAMILGYFIATFFGNYSKIFEPLGTIFIRLLKMIIVPLVSLLENSLIELHTSKK